MLPTVMSQVLQKRKPNEWVLPDPEPAQAAAEKKVQRDPSAPNAAAGVSGPAPAPAPVPQAPPPGQPPAPMPPAGASPQTDSSKGPITPPA